MPRHINADDLAIKFRMLAEDPWNKDTGTTWSNAYEECADDVDEFPTADVVEKERYDILLEHANILAEEMRKYQTAEVPERNVGKWIFGFDEETGERDLKAWTCSLCGEKYPWQPNFCPHCGARMNGGETEDE